MSLLDRGPELEGSDAADKSGQAKPDCVIGWIHQDKELQVKSIKPGVAVPVLYECLQIKKVAASCCDPCLSGGNWFHLGQETHEIPASHPFTIRWGKSCCLCFSAVHFLSFVTVIHQVSYL